MIFLIPVLAAADFLCNSVLLQQPSLQLVRTIPLPNVTGRIDHLTLDAKGGRLWLAALENDTVEVIDLEAGKRIRSIDGLKEPQGLCAASASNSVVVASGEDGTLRSYDDAFRLVASESNLDDADNLRFEPAEKRIYVGYGRGAIAVLDSEKLTKLAEIKLDQHPESFQLERTGRRLFVNVPRAGQVAVIDRDQLAVVATWPVTEARSNFPMALDESRHRLFIGCRRPERLLVLDTESGKPVASLVCCGDVDDVFFDADRQRLYLSGGDGSISVIQQIDADHYRALESIPTALGARTSLFVAGTHRLYLAVPRGADHEAQVREYRVLP